jgi:hypothetical protein
MARGCRPEAIARGDENDMQRALDLSPLPPYLRCIGAGGDVPPIRFREPTQFILKWGRLTDAMSAAQVTGTDHDHTRR